MRNLVIVVVLLIALAVGYWAFYTGGDEEPVIIVPDPDGIVSPDMDTDKIFSDPANPSAVQLILGTNRD
jgi:hypothetical protein